MISGDENGLHVTHMLMHLLVKLTKWGPNLQINAMYLIRKIFLVCNVCLNHIRYDIKDMSPYLHFGISQKKVDDSERSKMAALKLETACCIIMAVSNVCSLTM